MTQAKARSSILRPCATRAKRVLHRFRNQEPTGLGFPPPRQSPGLRCACSTGPLPRRLRRLAKTAQDDGADTPRYPKGHQMVGFASLHPPYVDSRLPLSQRGIEGDSALDSRLRGNLLHCGTRVVPGDCHGAFGASQRQLNTTERRLRATRRATSWWVPLRCTHPTRWIPACAGMTRRSGRSIERPYPREPAAASITNWQERFAGRLSGRCTSQAARVRP